MASSLAQTRSGRDGTDEAACGQDFWHALLACPDCGTHLPDIVVCPECGREFEFAESIPSLVTRREAAQVEYRLGPETNIGTYHELLMQVLQDPGRRQPKRKLPYHLDPAHAAVLEALPAGSIVLEIGCGGGQVRKWIQSRGLKYVGTDVTTERVFSWLQSHGGPDLLSDAHQLPFRSRSVDVVYCAAVFEHLACPPLAAREVLRTLKPGGRFLGNCAFLEPWHDNSYFHMSPSGVCALLTQTGFEVDAIWPGRGYSGFKALYRMSGWLPRTLQMLGLLTYAGYRVENKVNALFRRWLRRPSQFSDIEKRARVAGAVDWIARAPQETQDPVESES